MLRPSKGNMYDFITHTWNPIKGICYHKCSYCYMDKIYKRFGKTPAPLRLDEKELHTNLGSGNFIFVGSSIDIFSDEVELKTIIRIMEYCYKSKNKYLFQTKNPDKLSYLISHEIMPLDYIACVTLETNRQYPVMGRTPAPQQRADFMNKIYDDTRKMITIEPIMDFDLPEFLRMIKYCKPAQVNIGADTGNNGLPEPPKKKILELISELKKFTGVVEKKNLKRLVV